jgi:hypothetical protein
MIGPDQDWRHANLANWDERVAIHLGAECHDLGPLRAGCSRLNPIEEIELGPVDACACCICNVILVATA